MLYLCILSTFMLPLAYSGNLALPNSSVHDTNEKTNLLLASEGGTVIASNPDVSLPKNVQQTNLFMLDEELQQETNKGAPVKPRKGVGNFTDAIKHNNNTELQNGTDVQFNNSIVNENATIKNTTAPNIIKPSSEVPKKPLVLSYEALVNADKNIEDVKILATNPSPKTLPNLAKSQIPSPNDDIVKVYPMKANSHPGMIMPIVITILVVPMFALVGYMALKRGKEAWKNRHYKRMDFLLDGMYND